MIYLGFQKKYDISVVVQTNRRRNKNIQVKFSKSKRQFEIQEPFLVQYVNLENGKFPSGNCHRSPEVSQSSQILSQICSDHVCSASAPWRGAPPRVGRSSLFASCEYSGATLTHQHTLQKQIVLPEKFCPHSHQVPRIPPIDFGQVGARIQVHGTQLKFEKTFS